MLRFKYGDQVEGMSYTLPARYDGFGTFRWLDPRIHSFFWRSIAIHRLGKHRLHVLQASANHSCTLGSLLGFLCESFGARAEPRGRALTAS